jgi:hypothetical protein
MADIEPFALFDCSLARLALGRSCTNLRELLDAVRTVPDSVLEHHMMRCVLDDHFELYEFPNDLARWSWEALGDQALAEQFGLVDPYQLDGPGPLRTALSDAIEARLWGLDRVPWCRPGLELHLIDSRLIAYDTGERFSTPTALAESLPHMSRRSLYFHAHEAYRRTKVKSGDFSVWLENCGADPMLVARLRAIDFYFMNLNQLRDELMGAFRQFVPDPQATRV